MGVFLSLIYTSKEGKKIQKSRYILKTSAYPESLSFLLPSEDRKSIETLKYYKFFLILVKNFAVDFPIEFKRIVKNEISINDIDEDLSNVKDAIRFYNKNKDKYEFSLSVG